MVSRAQMYVVIPAYNEGPVISRVVSEVNRAGYAVVVVDDGSSDATAEEARAAGAGVITHPFNLGQGAALQTGIDYAVAQGADVIVTFDADGQHRVSDIARLTEALVQERVDFALGSRFLGQAPNLPPLRRLLLHAATAFTRLTTGLQVTDTHNGLRAMTRRRHPPAAEPDGACVGVADPDRRQPPSLRRTASHHRIYRLLARQRPEPRRRCAYFARSLRAQALPMIAQLILSILLAGILIYAWSEYARSPAVAVLALFVATAGLYFVWVP